MKSNQLAASRQTPVPVTPSVARACEAPRQARGEREPRPAPNPAPSRRGRQLVSACAALAVLSIAGAAAAKPLYVTVPRSYASSEKPVVEVAFEDRGPVELRVLRPTDADAFIQSQANLRRAYETPPTQANPGHALARGLNALRSPGPFLLFSMNPGLRQQIAPALPQRPEPPSGRVSRVAPGPEKLVGLPKGMKLVRSQWLNLDLGGAEREFTVPGFDAWFHSGGFQERRVALEPLPAGLYVLQVVQGRIEGQVVLVVSDLTVQAKQTDGLLLVRVAGVDQQPKQGAKVTVRLPGGETLSGTTDEKGEARVEVTEPRLLVAVAHGEDLAVVDTDFYSTLAIAPDVFLYTDRPIYKPGDQMRFRGVVRKPDSFLAQLFTPKKREVSIELVSQGTAPVKTRAVVGEYGTFAGTFRVPEGLSTGVLRVVAQLDEQAHQSEARVQQYVKPTFYLEVLSDAETVEPGGKVKAKVRARRYAGGAEPGAAYEVFLYRSLLDSPAWVDDAGMGGKGSEVTYGSVSTTEGKLSVPERLYSSVAARAGSADPFDPWSSAATLDENGEAEIEIDVPALGAGDERKPFRYTLTVRARDGQGTFANASRAYFLAPCEVLGTLRPSAKVAKTGGEARLSVRAATLSGKAYGETSGRVEFVLRSANGEEASIGDAEIKTDAEGIWRGEMPTSGVGTVLARVTLKDKKNAEWSGEASLLCVGEGGEPVARVANLTLESLGGVLEPGQSAELIALLPDGWGAGTKNEGPVWITLSGSTLFDTRLVRVTGSTLIHRFEIEKRFGSAVYASIAYPTSTGRWEERTVPFRIIPKERTLSVAIEPGQPEAKPLGRQTLDLRVTDSEGRGVPAQVSVGVVDKAIYALQSELRPRALEFFYPLGRDNVSSYYSAEFQGYGYGERLAKKLAGLPEYAFSAVKPPTRQVKPREEDTAYWNPSVVTDAQGHARVSFEMPSNQTLWLVTAVAADASGRFGEGTAEFASRGGVNLVAAVPQFLREGDEARGSLRVARGGEESRVIAKLDVSLAASGGLKEVRHAETVALPAQGELIVPLMLTASKTGFGELLVEVGGGERLADRRRLPIHPAAFEETMEASGWGGGELALAMAEGARAEAVELVLKPTLVDAALSTTRDLLEYPYGCLEQLVSTTIPNVAVFRTLEKVDALAKLDPQSRALLAEARSRAVQGVHRILSLEVKGGGFTWFHGYSTPSLPLTLVALDGLTYAIDAGLVARSDPRLVESTRWLEAQTELPFELEATRTYVLARLEGARHAARVRALVARAEPGDLYTIAIAVLAAEHAKVDGEPELRERIAALVQQSNEGFVKLADWRPDEGQFWRYPLRRVGLSAIVAHAASKGSFDVARARRRLVEALTSEGRLSTFDRGTALLHSLWLIERDAKELKSLPPPNVQLASGAKVSFAPRGGGLVATLPPGTGKLKVEGFEGVATLRAQVQTPLDKVQPVAEGMSIERRYYVLREGGRQELEAGQKVAQGEEVYVELTVNAHLADARSARSAYYFIEDSVPAGFAPLIEDKEWRGEPHLLPLAHEALRLRALDPEKATFFFEEPAWWSDSPRVIGYVMRAQFPGRFQAPPARVEDMYAPSVRGRTGPAVLEIEASDRPTAVATP